MKRLIALLLLVAAPAFGQAPSKPQGFIYVEDAQGHSVSTLSAYSGSSAATRGSVLITKAASGTSTQVFNLAGTTFTCGSIPSTTPSYKGQGPTTVITISGSTLASLWTFASRCSNVTLVGSDGTITIPAVGISVVTLHHKDGTQRVFAPTANTDAARGTAFRSAVAAAVAYDTLTLGGGTFDMGIGDGVTAPANFTIEGTGSTNTSIIGTCTNAQALIYPASGLRLKNLSIAATTGICIWNNAGAIDDVRFDNCSISGDWDTFVSSTYAVTNAKFFNCSFASLFDGFFWKDGSAEFNHCTFTITSGAASNRRAALISDGTTFVVRDSVINVTQTSSNQTCYGYWAKAGTCSAEFDDVQFTCTNSNAGSSGDVYGINNDITGGTVMITGGTRFSTTTSGGGTPIDTTSSVGSGVQYIDPSVSFSAAGPYGATSMYWPKMTSTLRDGLTPTEGVLIYNTTAHAAQIYDGSSWLTPAAPAGTLAITSGKTLTATNTLTFSGTDSTTMTFPGTSATIARTDAANTFTGASNATSWNLSTPILVSAAGGSTDGQLTNDSTQKAVRSFVNNVAGMHGRTLFTQTASVTVANTTTYTTVVGTGVGTVTLPANYFVVGKSIRVTARGFYSQAAADGSTISCQVQLGGTALGTIIVDPAGLITADVTTQGIAVEAIITCRATGSSNTIMEQAEVRCVTASNAGSTAIAGMTRSSGLSNINTANSQAVDLKFKFGVGATASETITITNLVIEELN